jgi:hypothetical protein
MTPRRGFAKGSRVLRFRSLPFAALALAACSPSPVRPEGLAGAFQPALVEAPRVTEGAARKIALREDVPLLGPRVDAKPGDFMLTSASGMTIAVIGADGRLLDLGPRGGQDELSAVDSTLFFGFEGVHLEPERAALFSEGRGVHVVRRVLEKPLALHVFASFQGEQLRLETTVVATAGLSGPVAVTLGEWVWWGNVPTWAEGQGFVTRRDSLMTEFIAREAYGGAYALRPESGKMMARFEGGDSGFFATAVGGETPELVPPDRTTSRRVVLVAYGAGSIGRAIAAVGTPAAQRVRVPAGLPPEARVEVSRCAAGSKPRSPYARYLPGDPEIALPEGCFEMRLTAPGHAPTAWFPPAEAAGKALSPAGTLRFAVTDEKSGKPIPARVRVRGVKGTADPDWGTDADRGAALDMIHAESGAGERALPPGSYHVSVDRGFEYTAVEEDVEVAAGKTVEIRAALLRVVDTRGYLAADLHLHAMPSPDAPQPLADRVRALAATGVEVGVSTDHNKVTDYGPTIAELGLRGQVASVVGDEITTRDPAWGHFNAFPLPAGSEPLPYRGKTPAQLFGAARAAGATVVQLNHPRMGGIGYFDLMRFDRDDVAGWARRVTVADMSFDAIEVFNGDHYALLYKVDECLRDWYALLEAGYRFTATGNSDSHRLSYHEPGAPRNLVAVPDDDPARFDERAFLDSVSKGRVVVSSGPFVRLTAGGKTVGDTVPAGEVEISVVVEAPPWVDIDRIDLVRRGEVIQTWTGPFGAAPPAPPPPEPKADPKKRGAKAKPPEPPPPPPPEPLHVERKTTKPLAEGDWIIAVVRGSKPMSFLHRSGARPFAFTNPIWIQ